MLKSPTRDSHAEAIGLYERALALDPQSAEAQALPSSTPVPPGPTQRSLTFCSTEFAAVPANRRSAINVSYSYGGVPGTSAPPPFGTPAQRQQYGWGDPSTLAGGQDLASQFRTQFQPNAGIFSPSFPLVPVEPELTRLWKPEGCPQPRQFHADAGATQGGGAVVTDQPAREADQDRRQGRKPWPPRHVPDGRSRGIWAVVQRNPLAHCPVAGATRTSMKRPRIKFDGQERQRRASMKAKQRAPAPANQATHSSAWHPSRGIVVMDAQQQTIALTGAGIVECRLNPRSPTLRIRGCTYCRAAPIGETI